MTHDLDLFTRLFMLALCAVFGLSAGFSFAIFGVGVASAVLSVLAVLSVVGYLQASPSGPDQFTESVAT